MPQRKTTSCLKNDFYLARTTYLSNIPPVSDSTFRIVPLDPIYMDNASITTREGIRFKPLIRAGLLYSKVRYMNYN